MTAIIPIPAFADNYIWLLREGVVAAVVDPARIFASQQAVEPANTLFGSVGSPIASRYSPRSAPGKMRSEPFTGRLDG